MRGKENPASFNTLHHTISRAHSSKCFSPAAADLDHLVERSLSAFSSAVTGLFFFVFLNILIYLFDYVGS